MIVVNQVFVRLLALSGRLKDDEGQGMTEYALILALIIAISAGLLVVFGSDLKAAYNNIAADI